MPSRLRPRAALLAALLVVTAVGAPAFAASKPKKLPRAVAMSWTDQSGDANGINTQAGIVAAAPSTATPVQDDGSDILGVSISRVDDGYKVSAIKVTLKLSAPPRVSVLYRLIGSTPGCSTFWFQYSNYVDGASSALRNNCTPSGSPTSAVSNTVNGPVTAAVQGSSIVWTVRVKELPDGVKLGTAYSPAYAETRAIIGAGSVASATIPTIDETATQTKKYTLGQ
jgi:hypothetical protein